MDLLHVVLYSSLKIISLSMNEGSKLFNFKNGKYKIFFYIERVSSYFFPHNKDLKHMQIYL